MKSRKVGVAQKSKLEREGVMQSERLNTSISLGKQMNFKALNQPKAGSSPVRYKRAPAV